MYYRFTDGVLYRLINERVTRLSSMHSSGPVGTCLLHASCEVQK